MCGIFGSRDKELFKALARLNSVRGSHTCSISSLQGNVFRFRGEMTEEYIDSYFIPGEMNIGHIQAPTNGITSGLERSHPHMTKHSCLWHNGVLTEKTIKQFAKTEEELKWDTALLHRMYKENLLEDVDGSFSCAYMVDKSLWLFRNGASPMFHDIDGNFSSVSFGHAVPTQENVIYLLYDHFEPMMKFENSSCPYFLD